MILDTGATSSLVSRNFVKLAGIKLEPTTQAATGVNKTPIGVLGEIKVTLYFDGMDLPITALIVENLDSDFLAGIPFGMQNKVHVFLDEVRFTIHGNSYSYGARKAPPPSDIYQTQSMVLRSDSKQVVMPGDYVELSTPSLEPFNGEVSIEPRFDSPNKGSWPQPKL